jgi:hypothetical protein
MLMSPNFAFRPSWQARQALCDAPQVLCGWLRVYFPVLDCIGTRGDDSSPSLCDSIDLAGSVRLGVAARPSCDIFHLTGCRGVAYNPAIFFIA